VQTTTTLSASAPGKILLLGSYAVLEGQTALVIAYGPRLQAFAEAGSRGKIELYAPQIMPSPCSFELGKAPPAGHPAGPDGPLNFLGAIFADLPRVSWDGLRIRTESEIPPGLGSSAALVTTACALRRRLTNSTNIEAVSHAYKYLRTVQGGGSGADLAAVTVGGAISYQLNAGAPTWEALGSSPPAGLRLSVWRKGSKTDTSAAIRRWKEGEGRDLASAIGSVARRGVDAWRAGNAGALIEAVDEAQRLQIRLGAVSESDAAWMQQLRSVPGVAALVATGAGGGEALAVLWRGTIDPYEAALDWFPDLDQVPGPISTAGLEIYP